MILVWFNPKNCVIYHRYIKTNKFSYFVGLENSYGHILVQILLFENGDYYNITSYDDYYYENLIRKRYEKKHKRLISFARKLLNKN